MKAVFSCVLLLAVLVVVQSAAIFDRENKDDQDDQLSRRKSALLKNLMDQLNELRDMTKDAVEGVPVEKKTPGAKKGHDDEMSYEDCQTWSYVLLTSKSIKKHAKEMTDEEIDQWIADMNAWLAEYDKYFDSCSQYFEEPEDDDCWKGIQNKKRATRKETSLEKQIAAVIEKQSVKNKHHDDHDDDHDDDDVTSFDDCEIWKNVLADKRLLGKQRIKKITGGYRIDFTGKVDVTQDWLDDYAEFDDTCGDHYEDTEDHDECLKETKIKDEKKASDVKHEEDLSFEECETAWDILMEEKSLAKHAKNSGGKDDDDTWIDLYLEFEEECGHYYTKQTYRESLRKEKMKLFAARIRLSENKGNAAPRRK